MTTIELARDKRRFYTLVDGHAGYDDAGRDIVCAGVSALTYALAAGLNDCGALLKYESGDGREEMYGAGELRACCSGRLSWRYRSWRGSIPNMCA